MRCQIKFIFDIMVEIIYAFFKTNPKCNVFVILRQEFFQGRNNIKINNNFNKFICIQFLTARIKTHFLAIDFQIQITDSQLTDL